MRNPCKLGAKQGLEGVGSDTLADGTDACAGRCRDGPCLARYTPGSGSLGVCSSVIAIVPDVPSYCGPVVGSSPCVALSVEISW